MSDEAERAIQRVAEAIEAYLARHPVAADSEQGIAQWWLPAMGVDVALDTVRRALELLVRRGVVIRTVLPGGPAIYRAGGGKRVPRGGTAGNGGQVMQQARTTRQ